MLTLRLIITLTVSAALQLAPHLPSLTINSQNVPKTVQVSLDVNADILIQNSDGKRIGLDFKTGTFVNEIPDARVIEREDSSTFVLPYDKSGKPYTLMLTGKVTQPMTATLSMTGPGFIAGVRKLNLISGDVQILTISSTGDAIAVTATQNGPTPQVFLTTQSDRGKPSYRFEVAAASLSPGKIMTVDLDLAAGRLNFKSTAITKSIFTVNIRRTNPDGTRDTFSHQEVSFARGNSYAMDFGKWDGKGDVCFYDSTVREAPCTPLKNEVPARQPN